MLRAVIFDFNGIIVDDEPIHFKLFQRVLGEEGITLTEKDYYARYLGFDDRGAFTAGYYQEAIRNHVTIFPGVKSLIADLAPRLPLAVASGALRDEIEAILSTAALLHNFTAIIAAEDVAQGKPEPEIFLKALERINAGRDQRDQINAADCLVIEDSKEGIKGARRAGMKCLAVTNSHPAQLLKDANAVVKSLTEVDLDFLESLYA